MADLSQATMGRGAKKVKASAMCLEHNMVSHEWRGIQSGLIDDNERFLAFRCKGKDGHIFLAIPPEGFPRRIVDMAEFTDKVQRGDLVLPGLQ